MHARGGGLYRYLFLCRSIFNPKCVSRLESMYFLPRERQHFRGLYRRCSVFPYKIATVFLNGVPGFTLNIILLLKDAFWGRGGENASVGWGLKTRIKATGLASVL